MQLAGRREFSSAVAQDQPQPLLQATHDLNGSALSIMALARLMASATRHAMERRFLPDAT